MYMTGILLLILCTCCSAETSLKPGLVLTFDDRNIENWEKQIPLFEKYNAHVTFFIDHFDMLTPDQMRSLRKLKDAGHAIGCHGLRHLRAPDYCEKYSVEKYISDEIEPAIIRMNKEGFHATCFAYPNSAFNELTDQALLKYFRHLRSGCGIEAELKKTERVFTRIADIKNKGRLDGISFHPKSPSDDLVTQVKQAVGRIKENREILVLYAHDIRNAGEEGPKNYITADALEEILSFAASNQIAFYSFDELP